MHQFSPERPAEASQAPSAPEGPQTRALLHALPDTLFRLSKDGVFLDFMPSPGFEALIAPESFLGKAIHEVMPPEVTAASERCIAQALATGEVQTFEYELAVGGTPRYYEARLVPAEHEEDVLAIVRDITERRRAEKRLRQAEQRYHDLFEEAPVMYVITENRDGVPFVADCNERFLDTLDYRREEVVGRPLADFYSPASCADLLAGGGYERALAGSFAAEERQLLTRDGQAKDTLLRAVPEVDAQGRVTGTRAMYVNITERKRAEQALRESEQRWRSLVENHPEPIMITIHAEVVYLNEAGARIFGAASAEELYGRSVFEFVTSAFTAEVRRRARQLEQRRPTRPMEFEIVGLDGEKRYVESSSVPVLYNGQPAAQTMMRETTERRRYERALIEAKEHAVEMSRLKSTFLANMSHEIRTPLTSIIGFADILAEEATEENREFAHLIRQSGQRLMQTLNSVLDLAQLEGGTLRLSAERFDVVTLAQQVLDLFKVQALQRSLDLRLAVSEAPILVHLDAGALSRVLTNLVSNAMKFTAQGYVEVGIAQRAEGLEIRVEDTGIGISPEFLPRMFTEFYQESSGLTRGYEGSGLGLAITRRLVEMMGGVIDVASEKGRGAVFTVRLPLPTPPDVEA